MGIQDCGSAASLLCLDSGDKCARWQLPFLFDGGKRKHCESSFISVGLACHRVYLSIYFTSLYAAKTEAGERTRKAMDQEVQGQQHIKVFLCNTKHPNGFQRCITSVTLMYVNFYSF